jgi:hypothetical protein
MDGIHYWDRQLFSPSDLGSGPFKRLLEIPPDERWQCFVTQIHSIHSHAFGSVDQAL